MKHKFQAKRTEIDSINFPSKLEATYYQQLLLRQKSGEILFFLRQVPFHIHSIRYVVDFVLFLANGDIEFVDVKGIDTPLSIAKRKIVMDVYPIEIKIVSKV